MASQIEVLKKSSVEQAKSAFEAALDNLQTNDQQVQTSIAAASTLSPITFNRGFSGDNDLNVVPTTSGAVDDDISWYLKEDSFQLIRLESGVWADWGLPIATKKLVDDKASLLQADIDDLEASQQAGAIGFEDKATMDADTTRDEGTIAVVTNDATASNNGYYRWDDTVEEWVKRSSFYASELDPEDESEAVTGKATWDYDFLRKKSAIKSKDAKSFDDSAYQYGFNFGAPEWESRHAEDTLSKGAINECTFTVSGIGAANPGLWNKDVLQQFELETKLLISFEVKVNDATSYALKIVTSGGVASDYKFTPTSTYQTITIPFEVIDPYSDNRFFIYQPDNSAAEYSFRNIKVERIGADFDGMLLNDKYKFGLDNEEWVARPSTESTLTKDGDEATIEIGTGGSGNQGIWNLHSLGFIHDEQYLMVEFESQLIEGNASKWSIYRGVSPAVDYLFTPSYIKTKHRFTFKRGLIEFSDNRFLIFTSNTAATKIKITNFKVFGASDKSQSEFNRIEQAFLFPNIVPKDSRAIESNSVADNSIGSISGRVTDYGTTTVSKVDDGFQVATDGGSGNLGLIDNDFFKNIVEGTRFKVSFSMKLISGDSSWRLAIGSGAGITSPFTVTSEFQEFEYELEFNKGYGDERLIIFQNGSTASTIVIKGISVQPLEDGYEKQSETIQVNEQHELNTSNIPNYLYKTASLLVGTSTRLVIGLFGDSWTQVNDPSIAPLHTRYTTPIATALREKYGDGGGGFFDFSESSSGTPMNSVDPADADVVKTGTITYYDETAGVHGINNAHGEFESGATVTLNVTTAHTKLVLHYYESAGTFRYRIDSGAWNDVDASVADGYTTIDEVVTDATHVIEFEVTSGTVIILGVDMQRNSGVTVHKLGNRGLKSTTALTISQADFIAAVQALELDTVTILLGTNDKTNNRPPEDVGSNITSLLNRFESANEYIDQILISPSNNETTNAYEMSDYASRFYSIANERGIAYLSLIPIFGTTEQIIARGTFFDTVHPTVEGGRMIAEHMLRKILV